MVLPILHLFPPVFFRDEFVLSDAVSYHRFRFKPSRNLSLVDLAEISRQNLRSDFPEVTNLDSRSPDPRFEASFRHIEIYPAQISEPEVPLTR